jgi:putative SOS response-associated peptidase YedK
MCNHYRGPISKANLALEVYGFEEFSETRIDVFPDRPGLVIRRGEGGRLAVSEMRWGFPPAPGRTDLVTNVRNLSSPFWRPFLGPANRCLVPFSAFAEYAPGAAPRREVWFHISDDRPAAFAGIWRSWDGERGPKKAPIPGPHQLFAFLTCEPNSVVRPYHPKAMPVILIGRQAQVDWLTAPASAVTAIATPVDDEDVECIDV